MSRVELTVVQGDPVALELSLGPSVMDGDKGDVLVASAGASWTVEGIQGRDVVDSAPSNLDVLTWSTARNRWEPTAAQGGGGVSDGDKGDITVSGSGATWTIDNDAVTFAKFQNVKDARLIGRESGAGTGDAKEIQLDSQFVWTTIGGNPALSVSVPSDATKVDTTTSVSAGTGLTGGGDLSASRTISVATSGITTTLIADANVTLAKLANLATDRLIGRQSSGTGVPEAITCTSAGRALLDDADAAAQRTTLGLGTVATESTVPVAKGGTGQTTAVAAFDALAPTTTKGDLIAFDGTDNVRLAVGVTDGHVLTVDSATATGLKWDAAAGGGTTVTIDTQEFHLDSGSQNSATWTKPANARLVYVSGCGGGGAGNAGLTTGNGGTGGTAATGFETWLLASMLGATETVTIGAGGTAPAGNGGDTTFAGFTLMGGRGPSGTSVADPRTVTGGVTASGFGAGSVGSGGGGRHGGHGPGGGGGGGGFGGSAGGKPRSFEFTGGNAQQAGGAAGGANNGGAGTAANSANDRHGFGEGGGGGGGFNGGAGTGGAGGAGRRGSGGGGGGQGGTAGGAGGAGGGGYLRVTTLSWA